MATINYSGSQDITGCTITSWTDDTYYSFKLTEDCKLSISGTPAINARVGDEFVIQMNEPYIFDRETKVMLAYPDPTEESTTLDKYSVTSDTSVLVTTSSDLLWFEKVAIDTQTRLSGHYKFTFGMSQWKTTSTDGSQYTDFKITQFGPVEKEIMPARRYWSTSDVGMKYPTHSFILPLELSEEYIFSLAWYSQEYLQIGSSTILSKMIIEELPTSSVYAGAYDLNYAHIEEEGYDATAYDSAPTGLDFSSDGTKLFIAGDTENAVDQYSLSPAYSIADGDVTYDGTYSVSTYEGTISDVAFGNSGSIMYITGTTGDDINSFTLTTPYVITSGVTYRSTSSSLATQDTAPQGIAWNSDGTKLLMAGGTNDTIFQYTASTAWDETTLSYDSKSLDVSDRGDVVSIDISDDDLYFFVIFDDHMERYEFSSTAFDIELVTAEVQGLNLNIQSETSIKGGRLSNSGKQFTYIGSTTEILKSIQLGYQDV